MQLFGRGKAKTPLVPEHVAAAAPAPGSLPAWATMRSADRMAEGFVPVVDVDADGMYQAWLAELRTYYANNVPAEFMVPNTKDMKDEWVNCVIDLNTDPTTQYWLESAYHCGKMELQIAMRTFKFEIHIHDEGKKYAQKAHKPGRGAHRAAGGFRGGVEARDHFKRLRGFIPS